MAKACPTPMPFRAVAGTVSVVTLLFFFTFVSRFVFSPLFPAISKDLGLKSGQAGSLFLLGALGMLAGSFAAGLISSRLKHRGTIIMSVLENDLHPKASCARFASAWASLASSWRMGAGTRY